MKLLLPLTLLFCLSASAQVSLNLVSTYKTGVFDEGAAEIVAFDSTHNQVFFTNADAASIGVLDISNPSNISLLKYIDITSYGSNANSVAVGPGFMVAAVENANKQDNGSLVFFDLQGNFIVSVTAGALPDMVAISKDGSIVMSANEGEPNDDYTVDPVGSVTIVHVPEVLSNLKQNDVVTLGFSHFVDSLLSPSVRVFGDSGRSSLAQDLEPEYISISEDGAKAFVVLQENNAFAVVDLINDSITDIFGLGFKNHLLPQNGFDASDKADKVLIQPQPTLGMFLPDAIKSFEFGGMNYIVTANEGDGRDYDGYSEEARVKDLVLDPVAFPTATVLQNDTNLGRLKITTSMGDTDGDGDFDELYSFGARSFSIYDENGNQVFDSGDQFERAIAAAYPNEFNSSNDDNDSYKNRSDDKGPEPEAIELALIDNKRYCFIGMERMGGIFVYDITNPLAPIQLGYFLNRNFDVAADDANAGDLGVEDIVFVHADYSPNGKHLLLTANEVSGTVSIFELTVPTSISEHDEKAFTLFPNPSDSKINVTVKGNYSLVDINGRILRSISNSDVMDVQDINPGLYLLINESGIARSVHVR